MNSQEQKTHRTVTEALDKRLTDVETVVAALDDRVSDVVRTTLTSLREERANRFSLADELRTAIGQERTHRLQLAEQQRAYVDRGDKPHDAFRARTWRERWRWLLRGT